MRSARSMTWRRSILIPWFTIVYWISLMIVDRAASIPRVLSTCKHRKLQDRQSYALGADISGALSSSLKRAWTLPCQAYLICVVGSSPASINSMCGHDGSQIIPLHQQLVLVPAALFINVNDSSGYFRDTLYHHLWNDNRTFGAFKRRMRVRGGQQCAYPPQWRGGSSSVPGGRWEAG